MTYLFRVGPMLFILSVQESKIGNTYPRIFVHFPDNSCLNYDLTLPAIFKMTETNWDSWLDGTEIVLNKIEEVRTICKEYGINWDAFEDLVFEQCKQSL